MTSQRRRRQRKKEEVKEAMTAEMVNIKMKTRTMSAMTKDEDLLH